MLLAPVLAPAVLLAAVVLPVFRSSWINATSPGGRYADPLAGAVEGWEGDELQDGPATPYDWVPASREAWSYRALLGRIGELGSSRRIAVTALGETRYGRESYPLVAVEVAPTVDRPRARVLLTSGVHGNERAGPEALVRFAELLVRSPELYREVAFDIVPVVNPWGWSHESRQNGAGKDINRDFSSSNTQEAALLRRYLTSRVDAAGRYDVALDHHESSKPGYFVYQYTAALWGLGPAFARVVEKSGRPLEREYREGGFAVRRGVLSIPAITLPYVSLLGRLSLEQYLRLNGTRHAYTLESPLSDAWSDRVRIHGEAIRAMLEAYLR